MIALLNGRALDVYDRLSTEDAADYDKLKDALLKHFHMTERGLRKKFRYGRPEKSNHLYNLVAVLPVFRKMTEYGKGREIF